MTCTDRCRLLSLFMVLAMACLGCKGTTDEGVEGGTATGDGSATVVEEETGAAADSSPEEPAMSGETSTEVDEALAGLSATDRELVLAQKVCPVSGEDLGSMGEPIAVVKEGKKLFVCCEGCQEEAEANFDKYMAQVEGQPGEDAAVN